MISELERKQQQERQIWWHKSPGELRWWLHWGRTCFHLQLSKPQFHMSLGASTEAEHTISGDFGGIFWHIESWALSRKLPKCSNSFRFYWHDWALWFCPWANDWESSHDDPWWRRSYSFDVREFFLGDSEYSSRETERFENIVIPMPERNYLATIIFEESTWKRPRWFPRVRKYSTVKLDIDAPKFPGKGENSWDQDPDCIYQMSVEGHSIPAAIGGYVKSVMEMRLKRSGMRSLTATGKSHSSASHAGN